MFTRSDRELARETDQKWTTLSHGQSFLRYIADRPIGQGLWTVDEPEAGLSFQSCLALIGVLVDLAPGRIAGGDGDALTDAGGWHDLDIVRKWQQFLHSPGSYLRHL